MIVYIDGALIAEDDACISVRDRGFTLGDGLFETMRAADGDVRRLDAHLARLRDGAGIIGLKLPWEDATIAAACSETLAANGLADGMLRLTVTRGAAPRGLLAPDDTPPTLVITAAPLPPPPPPARAIIATSTRRNEASPLARCKSLNYLDNIIARREADAGGADEALLLNGAGRLAEATIANLFVVLDSAVVTPAVSEGALPGVMRAAVIERFDGREETLAPNVFGRASEAFLTNSLGIRALIAVDGHPVGGGTPGPVTREVSAALN